jgi:1,4-dihydroxy-2-naphthoate octaprenyltransferase
MLIVVGTYYVQTSMLAVEAAVLGAVVGLLSSTVLYVNSIPDIKPDREGGRRTLAILLDRYGGKEKLYFLTGLFVLIYFTAAIFFMQLANDFTILLLPAIFLLPLVVKILGGFKNYFNESNDVGDLDYVKIMGNTVLFSRLFGIALILGITFVILFRLNTT